ncbi:hypothetical protein HOLleu_39800 [Holothuria leucospilota]|uniref:Endonuclease/exonuclease/phosphatase domain-containing protein n=1 Tax=Holothuria leucospilota TaxID=206669 RepID=A0A9Q1BD28_HOLLE|nr:hypothetical protein HOLleu_39800 [Holothuria leucospilota]
MDLTLSSLSPSLRLLLLYKPSPSKKYKLTFSMLLHDFGCLTESLISDPCHFLFAGDFNIHVDASDNHDAVSFRNLLDTSDFHQHVTGSTHKAGPTLDLLISNNCDDLISSVSTLPRSSF